MCLRRYLMWRTALAGICSSRVLQGSSSRGQLLLHLSIGVASYRTELLVQRQRSISISSSDFSFNFNALGNEDCQFFFRFDKADVIRMSSIIGWTRSSTVRNQYAASALLVTCIVLRKVASPERWRSSEEFFGKHMSALSEIFWEGLEELLRTRGHLICGAISPDFIGPRAPMYARAIEEKTGGLSNVIGFIDGTVIGVAKPGDEMDQKVVYNGHKRKHSQKYQAVTAPDGIILHAFGPMEGRRHDWTLYLQSGIAEESESCLLINGKQYFIYGDSGYNRSAYLEVPYQGAALQDWQIAINTAMSSGRITVEWLFKQVKQYWTVADFKRKLMIGQAPVGSLYLGCLLLCNFRCCLYGSPISEYFDSKAPSLEEYVEHK